MASPSSDIARKIYLVSPRSGGPYKQYRLLAQELNQRGYKVYHRHQLKDWLLLHFNRTDIIVSVVPFLWNFSRTNLFLNIRGNYRRETRLSNPLSYLYNRNIKAARRVIVPSEYLKQELALDKTLVIPIHTEVRSVNSEKTSGKTINIATITNFDFKQKAAGINQIINIINQVETDQPIQLHVYGSGRWLSETKKQFELHGYKKFPVTFHGRFKNAVPLLAVNDIFVYWSTFDNMPNVLMEAAMAKLPIVVNNYGAFSELLGPDNLITNSTAEFAGHLADLIRNQAMRTKYGQQNYRQVQKHDVKLIADQWIQIIT